MTWDMRRGLVACFMWKSLSRVFQSVIKTNGGVMMSGARDTIAEVASESS
jgi:hypothetical protein